MRSNLHELSNKVQNAKSLNPRISPSNKSYSNTKKYSEPSLRTKDSCVNINPQQHKGSIIQSMNSKNMSNSYTTNQISNFSQTQDKSFNSHILMREKPIDYIDLSDKNYYDQNWDSIRQLNFHSHKAQNNLSNITQSFNGTNIPNSFHTSFESSMDLPNFNDNSIVNELLPLEQNISQSYNNKRVFPNSNCKISMKDSTTYASQISYDKFKLSSSTQKSHPPSYHPIASHMLVNSQIQQHNPCNPPISYGLYNNFSYSPNISQKNLSTQTIPNFQSFFQFPECTQPSPLGTQFHSSIPNRLSHLEQCQINHGQIYQSQEQYLKPSSHIKQRKGNSFHNYRYNPY